MPSDLIAIFGTGQSDLPSQHMSAGLLHLSIADGDVVGVMFDGVEVLRRIAYPLRNADWATLPARTLAETRDGTTYSRSFVAGDGAFRGEFRLQLQATAVVQLTATFRLTAQRDMTLNRAGFVALHPVDGVAGAPLVVTHSDGSQEKTRFPDLISPSQPVFDITGLAHRIGGVQVDLEFSGDVFEMEDQRNWSDASFKTYCRPLSRPRPFAMTAGEVVTQQITLTLSGARRVIPAKAAPAPVLCPQIELAANVADQTGLSDVPLLVRCAADTSGMALTGFAGRNIALEIVLPAQANPLYSFKNLARACHNTGISPTRVVALPAAYLSSYQPNEVWPDGPAPRDLIAPLRLAFPGCPIGTGVFTNFTELNRCPPDAATADYVTFSTTAIVHAADDLSVLQTLQALPDIVHSARHLAQGKPLRLGLVAIGMRSNPYGTTVAANPARVRVPMATDDPRQAGLFGAAWATAALAGVAGVDSVCLGMAGGPLGLRADGRLHPLFHLVRAAFDLGGQSAVRVRADGLAGLITRDGRGIVANIGTTAQPVPAGTTHVLSADTFAAAGADAGWLDRPGQSMDILPPFAVAFLRVNQ